MSTLEELTKAYQKLEEASKHCAEAARSAHREGTLDYVVDESARLTIKCRDLMSDVQSRLRGE